MLARVCDALPTRCRGKAAPRTSCFGKWKPDETGQANSIQQLQVNDAVSGGEQQRFQGPAAGRVGEDHGGLAAVSTLRVRHTSSWRTLVLTRRGRYPC